MIRSPLASRPALTHLARLRARPDEDGRGAALYCAMLLGLVVTTLLADSAQANRIRRVALKPAAEGAITLRLEGEQAPAFQVFRIPGENTFAVELPGSSLRGTKLDRPEDHPVLAQVRLDDASSGGARVVLRFLADVDYDAASRGRELEIQFRALSDLSRLQAAFQQRQNGGGPPATNASADQIKQREAELHARGLALEQKEKRLSQDRLELDEQRRDFQEERDAVSRLRKEVDQLRAQAELEQDEIDAARQKLQQEQLVLQKQTTNFAQEKKVHDENNLREQQEQKQRRAAEEKESIRLRREHESWASKVAEMQKEVRALDQRIAEQRATQRELDESHAHAQKSAEATAVLFQREHKALETQNQRLRVELTAIEEQVAALREQQQTESLALQRLQAERSSAERARREQQQAEQPQKASSGSAAFTARDQAGSDAPHETATLQAKMQSLRENNTQLAQQVAHLQKAQLAHQAQKEQLARIEQQLIQERERFQKERAVWQSEEARLQKQLKERKRTVSAQPARATSAEGSPGFGGGQDTQRPMSVPMTSGRLFEFGQGARMGGALHHLSVQRQDLFHSRVGLQIQGKIRYAVRRGGPQEIVLTLYDTYAANLDVRRILDTRDLGTNVLRILPRIVESNESMIELTIELRQPAAVSASAEGSILWLQIGQPNG